MVKNPPANTGDSGVRSLGLEDPLEKEMATHSSFLAWEIPWTEEPSGLQLTGSQSDTTEQLNSTTLRYFTLKLGSVDTVSLFSLCIWKPVSSPRRRGNRTGGVSGVGWQPSVFSL